MRNIELEKELERRMRRRGGYADRIIKHKDKVYKDSEKDEKYKDETDRLPEDEYNSGYKHKQERYRDDVERDHRHKMGRARNDTNRKKRSKDQTSEVESKNINNGSHRHTNKDVRRDDNKNRDESSDYRSRSMHDHHLELKRYGNDYSSSDHHRLSKQEETKYRDAVYEERARHNFNSDRDSSDKVCIDDLPTEKRSKSDSQWSPSSTNNISSHVPPQSPFGSSEDDRVKFNNPNWSFVDHNMVRSQTNWKNFRNWPYIPFHHTPPPIFNPFMYLSLPPMNMNHVTMPYNFTGHGFRNWDHGRTEGNEQLLEPNVVRVDLQSSVQKDENLVHEPKDEISSRVTGPHIENVENDMDYNTLEVIKVTESFHVSRVEKDIDDALISRIYLSKIDVSKDLTWPELYEQCKSMLMDFDQASSVFDESDYKILFLEEGIEDDIRNGPSLFASVDDSVFKKAMSLYKKQKAHFTATNMLSVEDQETIICAPSVGDCEVKVNNDGSKEVANANGSGSLLVLTNLSTSDLIFGSVNLSPIHSPE